MENNSINIKDLSDLREIISLACSRGAFRAEEMQQVGEVYNRLTVFLQAIVEQAQQQNQEQPVSDQSKGE